MGRSSIIRSPFTPRRTPAIIHSCHRTSQLKPDDIEKLEEAFSIYERESDGCNCIYMKHVGAVLRMIGQNPTDNELQEIVNEMDPEDKGLTNFPNFIAVIESFWKDIDISREIEDTFKYLCESNKKGDKKNLRVEDLEKGMKILLGQETIPGEVDGIIQGINKQRVDVLDFKKFAELIDHH